MELNAKDIIQAMKCCYTDDGSCLNCPCIDDYNSCVGLSKNALALIKQLTEEVADLKAIAEQYQKQFEDCYEEKAKLTEENERMRAEAEKLRKENIELNLKNQLLYDEGKTWYAEYHKTKEDLKQEKMYKRASEKLADKYCAELQTSKADTVREMQTKVAMCFGTYTDKDMTPITEVFRRLDRIAKEMLEGEK